MIQHIEAAENPNSTLNVSFIQAVKDLYISSLLPQCGIRKDARTIAGEVSGEKRSAFEIFQFLLLMVFQGCNLYRFLGSKKQSIACSKSTCHRFLSNEHYNWTRFIILLAARVINAFDKLTTDTRFRALVIDDSVIGRKRSKSVELLAFVFDHVIGKSIRGFNLLTVGWTDALERLVSIMAAGLANGKISMDESIRMEIIDWYISQPIFIQNICKEQLISAGFIGSGDHNAPQMSTAA